MKLTSNQCGSFIITISFLSIAAGVCLGGPLAEHPAVADQQTTASIHTHQAVVPAGWRRTKDGWENASTWPQLYAVADINELIAAGHERQPTWIRVGFAKLRSIPPLMIAVMQITAIAVIVNVDQQRRQHNGRSKTVDT